MKIVRSMHNHISAAEVYATAISKPFQEKKCRDAGARSWEVDVELRDDGASVRTKRKLAATGFPSLLRKFVPAGLTSTETLVWGPPDAHGSRTGELSVDFHGAPASLHGTVRVVADGDCASTTLVDLTLKAHVPLIGGRIEGFAAPIILGYVDAEETTGRAWAAGVR